MNRIVAIMLAALALLSAGWWGWSRSDLWPDGWDAPGPWTAPAEGPVLPAPAPRPEPKPAPEPEPAARAPAPEKPATTPAPGDAALPPETGSAMARETERAAEAAIAAAEARARAEATARAEREALEAAQTLLRTALTPFLTGTGFAPAPLRATLSELPPPASALTARALAQLVTQIRDILTEAEAALNPPGATGTAAPPVFDPAPYIARIQRLL